MIPDVQHWVEKFEMQAHPEGGFFAEVYRSDEYLDTTALPDRFSGPRTMGTSIYFLLPAGQYSRLHRIQSDEIWHFHTGGTLEVFVIYPDGRLEVFRVGPEGPFQAVVPRGTWFASRPQGPEYSLVGCTVAPGFDFADFELAEREQLLAEYPQHADIIRQLT